MNEYNIIPVTPPLFDKPISSNAHSPTIKEIRDVEKKLNKKLPQSYIDVLVNEGNGGRLRKYRFIDVNKNLDLLVTEFHGIGGDYDILVQQSMIEEWGYPVMDGVYFASVDGHQAFLFEYGNCTNENPEPTVVQGISDGEMFVREVAKDFQHFHDLLIDSSSNFDWIISPTLSLKNIELLLIKNKWIKYNTYHDSFFEFKNKEYKASLQLTINKYSDGSGFSCPEYPECQFILSLFVFKENSMKAVNNISEIFHDRALLIHSPHPFVVEENEIDKDRYESEMFDNSLMSFYRDHRNGYRPALRTLLYFGIIGIFVTSVLIPALIGVFSVLIYPIHNNVFIVTPIFISCAIFLVFAAKVIWKCSKNTTSKNITLYTRIFTVVPTFFSVMMIIPIIKFIK